MALIICPECGQEISEKAKTCIHCGKILIEEIPQTKICTECGSEVSIDSQECPFCGCPVKFKTTEKLTIKRISQKIKNNKLL